MNIALRFVGIVVFLCCSTLTAAAQSTQNSIPISELDATSSHMAASYIAPGASSGSITGHSYWGFDLGLTGTTYIGNQNFLWHLEDPTVIDPLTGINDVQAYMPLDNLGSGLGFLLGVKAAYPLMSNLDLEGKLRYLTNYTSRDETHDVVLARDPSTHQATITTSSSNSFSALLSNLSLAALLNLKLSDQFYGIGGFELSDLLSNSVAVHQALANGSTYFYSGTGDRSPATLFDQPPSSVSDYFNSTRLALQLGAGTAFQLSSGSSTLLDVELLFSIPLTEWLTSDAQNHLSTVAAGFYQPTITFPKLWYASLTVGIRFPFSSSNATYASDEAASNSSAVGSDGKVALQGRVTDANTGDPVDADITVVDLTNNESVATDHTDRDGRYNVRVRAPGRYSVTAEANGYLFGTSYFEVDKDGRILARHPDIKLSKSSGGKTRLLVFFDFGKSDLNPSSYPELDRTVRLMKAVPNMKVEIAGYTDSIGTPDFNRDLSEKRANSVRNYMIKKGIASNRVTAHGYGEASPIADNATEEGRAENRRVEFVVTNE